MANALLDTVPVDIDAGELPVQGLRLYRDVRRLYRAVRGEPRTTRRRRPRRCRRWRRATPLTLKELTAATSTSPSRPPRYTEASLIKTLEENGIGRPSTYAPTITTILARGYVEREGKALKPTALGEVTTKLMEEQFPKIVDVDFTANMEKSWTRSRRARTSWIPRCSMASTTDFDNDA